MQDLTSPGVRRVSPAGWPDPILPVAERFITREMLLLLLPLLLGIGRCRVALERHLPDAMIALDPSLDVEDVPGPVQRAFACP